MKGKIIAASAALLALSACTDPQFQQGGDRQRTAQGAGIGAALGAIVGATQGGDSNDRVRNAALGAAVGGLVGAGVGSVLDAQARELDESLGNGIEVINTGEVLIVRMPQDILFDVDSAAVRPALRADLFTLADSLQRYPNSTVTVTGHTDNTGSAAYNQDLSERRARSVVAVLVNAGVEPFRLRPVGAGENRPIASNLDPAGRQQNRRVDITIRPN